MATEKAFAAFHNSFWNRTIPLAPDVVRQINAASLRFDKPYRSRISENRGLINETAFRLFALARKLGTSVRVIGDTEAAQAATDALSYISRFREYSRASIAPLTVHGLSEARHLAVRMDGFFAYLVSERHLTTRGPDVVQPHFRGCGWLDACDGDAMHENILFEFKAGDRPFIGRDLRQVLVYLALSDLAAQYTITSLCLCNPRTGMCSLLDVDALCHRLAGVSRSELVGDITSYLSDGRGDRSQRASERYNRSAPASGQQSWQSRTS